MRCCCPQVDPIGVREATGAAFDGDRVGCAPHTQVCLSGCLSRDGPCHGDEKRDDSPEKKDEAFPVGHLNAECGMRNAEVGKWGSGEGTESFVAEAMKDRLTEWTEFWERSWGAGVVKRAGRPCSPGEGRCAF